MPRAVTTARHIASCCLGVRARLVSRAVTAVYEEELGPLGVSASQFSILVLLAQDGPKSVAEIGEVLAFEKSTLSRITARMLEHGWIDARPAAAGRGRELYAAPAGEELLNEARAPWTRAQKRAETLLGAGGAAGLTRAADALWSD